MAPAGTKGIVKFFSFEDSGRNVAFSRIKGLCSRRDAIQSNAFFEFSKREKKRAYSIVIADRKVSKNTSKGSMGERLATDTIALAPDPDHPTDEKTEPLFLFLF
ncbi:hypothetical protein CDAR_381801 [Caerostris darwini]|uniref:Uncharacterized protein n=1 Tax=Caerostris darwini TaxID=1538125 RepID=A0AAV4V6U2_9ARAC|nr:hypothetical protein CDAR_381801 [Caerostris darwini]